MRRTVTWLTCGLALLTFRAALGQEPTPAPDDEALLELDTVVVTADRREGPLKDTAEIIEVVSSDDIRRMNPSSTGELLEAVAGLNTESGTGSGFPRRSIVSLNGMPAQYTLVLLNGQKLLTEHIHTGQNVDMIPPEAIERVEIIKTAASALYGSDAIAGVVNIITKRDARAPAAKAYASYGSRRSLNTGMGVSTPLGEGARVSMFADWDRTDGLRVLAPQHRLDNMGYGRISLLNHAEMAFGPRVVADVFFNYFQNKMDWQGGEVHSRLLMPKAALHADVTDNWRVTGAVEYTSWESDLSTEQNELLLPKLFATWKGWAGRNQLTFGGDYRHHWFQRTGLDETMTQWGYGAFVHDALKLNDAWSFSASGRVDHVDGLEPVFSPKVAALFRPIDELGLRLAVGRGFHAPTVQELHEQAYGHSGAALRFGNPDLEPETSTAFSLSVEATPRRSLELFANGYLHLVENFIAPKYQGAWDEDPTKDMWVRSNILKAWIYGGELSARWTPLRWLRLETGYSYAGNQDESSDKQLQFHPGHALFGRIDLRFAFATRYRVKVFGKAHHRAGRSAWSWKPAEDAGRDDEQGHITELADYTLLDAGAELSYRRYTAFVTVTNLLSEDIERLDDALTVLDGAPLARAGLRFVW